MKSLQWLRGWVPAQHVQPEFTELRQFVTKSMACAECKRSAQKCPHPSGYWSRSLEIAKRNTCRPLTVVVVCFVLVHSCGLSAIRPFLVQIVKVFRVPVDANYCSVLVGAAELSAHVVLMFVVKRFGKRRMFLLSTGVSGVSVLGLAIIALRMFASQASSFDEGFVLSSTAVGVQRDNVLALVLFMVMAFSSGMAAGIPWMFLSEMFPMR